MEPATQSEVVRHWLRLEQPRPGIEPTVVGALDEDAVLDRLLQRKPGAAAFIWRDAPIDWFRLELTRDAFLELHVVAGPDELSWRALSPDRTIGSAAARLLEEDAAELADETGIDIGKILAFRMGLPESTTPPLVLSTRRGCVPWSVADGNHRAVAKAMHVLDGGTYRPQVAYLGIGVNPVVHPLRDRVCGLLRRLLGRSRPPR